MKKNIINCIFIFVVGVAFAFVSMVVVYCLPTDVMLDHAKEDVKIV